jgi:ABC-2 type transport system ATP-binding protein
MLCDRIGIIERGRIVALDTPTGLKTRLGGDTIKLKTKTKVIERMMWQFDFVRKIEQVDGFVVISVNNAKKALPILLRSIEAESAEFASPTLNEVFIQLTGNKIDEQAEGGFSERYAKFD